MERPRPALLIRVNLGGTRKFGAINFEEETQESDRVDAQADPLYRSRLFPTTTDGIWQVLWAAESFCSDVDSVWLRTDDFEGHGPQRLKGLDAGDEAM